MLNRSSKPSNSKVRLIVKRYFLKTSLMSFAAVPPAFPPASPAAVRPAVPLAVLRVVPPLASPVVWPVAPPSALPLVWPAS